MRRAGLFLAGTFAVCAALSAAAKNDRAEQAARARAAMGQLKYEEAAALWEALLAPGAPEKELRENLPAQGRCYEALKNYQKALTAYQRALQIDEKSVDRLLDLARVYTLVDLNREALSLYAHVMKLDKSRRDVTLALAQLYLKTGQFVDARREGAKYVEWEPRDPAGQRLMAELEEATGDLAAAARRREFLVSKDPTPQGYADLGRLWIRAGQWDMAEGAFAKAEDLGLRTGALYLDRGVIKWLKKDLIGARVYWMKALERHPGMGAAHFFLALLEREEGRADRAALEMRRARAGAQGDLLRSLTGEFMGGTKQ